MRALLLFFAVLFSDIVLALNGNVITLAQNTSVYVSTPATPRPRNLVLILLTDILGLNNNNKVLADEFAASGFTVLMPDLFRGNPWDASKPMDAEFYAWVANYHPGTVEPIIKRTIRYARQDLGARKIGASGYCFGGRYVFRLLGTDNRIKAGIATHPSLATEAEIAAVARPLQLVNGENDPMFPPAARAAAEATLIGKPHESIVYGQVEHGFAVTSDTSTLALRYARKKSQKDAVEFLKAYL